MGIEHKATIEGTPEEVWAWLARSGAIHRLVPPWQPMRVVSEAASLRDGVAKLRVAGVPWSAKHQPDSFIDGEQFVDQLTSFPLRLVNPWRHTHRISGENGATIMSDTVQTPVPAAALRGTFIYRTAQLNGDLAAHRQWSSKPLTIAMTGASGVIGTALKAMLSTGGHRVIALTRGAAHGPDSRQWDPTNPAPDLLDGIDAVVHLAGASIAGRFTDEHKRVVRDSRVGPTRKLAELAASAGVATFVSASAIGIYGADRGDENLDENTALGDDFLAEVVRDWESEAQFAAPAARVVQVRTGIVMTPRGGFLRQIRPLFTVGVGGRLGSGEQWISWIGIDDILDIYLRALSDENMVGPVNAVAPHPVRNSEFTKTLGKVMHRPTMIPVPSFGPKLLLGEEGAEAIAEASQRVDAAVLTSLRHKFRHPELEAALRHLLGKS
ncbi:MAG: TIGR01777 family oxidoreductase [Antricoccus sp.]